MRGHETISNCFEKPFGGYSLSGRDGSDCDPRASAWWAWRGRDQRQQDFVHSRGGAVPDAHPDQGPNCSLHQGIQVNHITSMAPSILTSRSYKVCESVISRCQSSEARLF